MVLAALVHSGDLVISIPGQKIDAGGIDQFAKMDIDDLVHFKHVSRPKGPPVAALQELMELFGLPKGLMTDPAKRDQALQQVQTEVAKLVDRVVIAENKLRGGISLWGKSLLSEAETEDWRSGLNALKQFLESLQPFTTAGKLSGFPHSVEDIDKQRHNLTLVREVESLLDLSQELQPLTSYLGTAEAILPKDNPWVSRVEETRSDLLTKVGSPKHRADPSFQRSLGQKLTELKSEYVDTYLDLHKKVRLNSKEDKTKQDLTKDPRLAQLQKLAAVEMMPKQQLADFENTLFDGLKTCFALSKKDLKSEPVCPHCSFRPIEEQERLNRGSGAALLHSLDERLDTLTADWTRTLLDNLADPTVAESIKLLGDSKGKKALNKFLDSKELPEPVEPAFVKALQEVLSGLERVVLGMDELEGSLAKGGLPCDLEQLKERFESHLDSLTKGKDPSKVRIVVE